MNITYIYLVTNCYNDCNKVYIGKTKNTRKNNHKCTFGLNITYDYIDEINSLHREDWKPLESYWIEQFKAWGFEVMNKNKGGGGPIKYSEEALEKMRKPKPIGFSEKISRANSGKIRTNEHKINYKGPKTKEHCNNISKALKGIPSSKKGIKSGPNPKISNNKERSYKISEWAKENRDKISNDRLGKQKPGVKVFDKINNLYFDSKVKCAQYNNFNKNKMRKLLDEGINYIRLKTN